MIQPGAKKLEGENNMTTHEWHKQFGNIESLSWRDTVYMFIKHVIFKAKEGEILPKPLRIIKFILFPIETTKWLLNTTFAIYDFQTDTFTIDGIRYSASFFRGLGKYGLKEGTKVEIVKREDGSITLKEIL